MSLYDCRGRFANDKEMARRRSVSREPQAMLACESLIQSKRADELISGSLIYYSILAAEKSTAVNENRYLPSRIFPSFLFC